MSLFSADRTTRVSCRSCFCAKTKPCEDEKRQRAPETQTTHLATQKPYQHHHNYVLYCFLFNNCLSPRLLTSRSLNNSMVSDSHQEFPPLALPCPRSPAPSQLFLSIQWRNFHRGEAAPLLQDETRLKRNSFRNGLQRWGRVDQNNLDRAEKFSVVILSVQEYRREGGERVTGVDFWDGNSGWTSQGLLITLHPLPTQLLQTPRCIKIKN